MGLSVISTFGVLIEKILFDKGKEDENSLTPFIFRFNFILTPVFFVSYFILISLESRNYSNYVFSTYHLQPDNFFNLVLLGIYLSFLGIFYFAGMGEVEKAKKLIRGLVEEFGSFGFDRKTKKIKFRELLSSSLLLISLFLLVVYFFSNLSKTLSLVFKDSIYILNYPNASYDEKMSKKWGLLYNLIYLIKQNTEIGDTILLPENKSPHSVDGRIEYYRYFLGDRNLISYDKVDSDIYKYDYILMVKGYLHYYYDGPANPNYVWPDFPVDSEKIIFLEFDNGSYSRREVIGDYNPEYFRHRNVWGLIKMKK